MWLKLDFLNYFTSTVSHPISNVYFASQSIHHRHPYYFNESFRKILIANSWKKPRNVWWLSNIVKLTLVHRQITDAMKKHFLREQKNQTTHFSKPQSLSIWKDTIHIHRFEIGCQPVGRLRPDSATSEFMLHGKFSLLAFTVWPFRTY